MLVELSELSDVCLSWTQRDKIRVKKSGCVRMTVARVFPSGSTQHTWVTSAIATANIQATTVNMVIR